MPQFFKNKMAFTYFGHCWPSVSILLLLTKRILYTGGTQTEGVREEGAEENIWTEEGRSDRRLYS
jgi:hypothetical protein